MLALERMWRVWYPSFLPIDKVSLDLYQFVVISTIQQAMLPRQDWW